MNGYSNLIFWSGIDYLHTDEKIILYFHKVKTHEIYITITRILNMIFVSIVFTFPIDALTIIWRDFQNLNLHHGLLIMTHWSFFGEAILSAIILYL